MAVSVPSTRRASIVRLLVMILAAAGLMVWTPGAAQAGDNGSWAVTPTPPDVATPTPRDYFVLEGTPGSVIKDQVRITNFTDKPITFQLYGADAYNTAQGGFFALQGIDEPQVDVGAWVKLPVRELTVAPRTQADAPVRIRVPENATPGDHVGGIVALNTAVEGTQTQGNVEIGIQRAVGARIYLRVAGPTRAGITVDDVRLTEHRGRLPWSGDGEALVTYTLENTGNLRQTPDVDVLLEGLFGRELDRAETEGVVDLLPGQKVTLTQKMSGIGHLDHVTATVSVATPEGATDHASTSVWVIPWLLIVALVLLGVGLFWSWRRRRTRVRKGLARAEQAPKITVPSL